MPPPTDLQFDGRLTNVAIQYQNEELIADLVMPPTPVPKKTGTFKTYAKNERYTLPSDKVGHKSEPNEVEWSTSSDTYACEDHGLKEYLSNEEIENADAPIQPQSDTVEFVTGLVQLAKEKAVADAVFNASNYAAGNQADIAGGWATLSDDALTDIEVGIDACFMRPNIMVMGLPTWRKLARNETILAACRGTLSPQQIKKGGVSSPAVNIPELAAFLGLDAVLVGQSRLNTAKKGQTASFSRVWDGTNATKGGAALLRVKKGVALRDVVWGANFAWKQRQVMTNTTTKGAYGGIEIRVVETYDLKSVATDVGYLFKDCLLT